MKNNKNNDLENLIQYIKHLGKIMVEDDPYYSKGVYKNICKVAIKLVKRFENRLPWVTITGRGQSSI